MPGYYPKPGGTPTFATTIGRVLKSAGYSAFRARKDTAFGGHRCSWDAQHKVVRVGYWCSDDTPESQHDAERAEMLGLYEETLTGKGYRVERSPGVLRVHPKEPKPE